MGETLSKADTNLLQDTQNLKRAPIELNFVETPSKLELVI
jgi:hypothetical protein